MNKLTKIVLSFLMVITCINFSTVQAEDGEEVNYSEPTTVETVSEDPANEVEQETALEEPAVEEATVEEAPAEQPAEEAAPVEEPQQEEVAPEASEEAQVEDVNNALEEATVAAEPQQEETTVAPEESQEEAKEEPAEVQKATVEISYVDEEDKEIADKVSDKEFDADFVVTADDKEVYKDIDGYTFKEAIVNDDADNRTFTADTIKLDGLKVTSDMNKVKLVYSKNPVTTKKDTTAKKTSKKSSGLLGALEKAVDTLTGKTEETSDDADPLSTSDETRLEEFFVVADRNTVTVGDKAKVSVTIKPDDYPNKDVTWATSDSAVAEVDTNGVVTTKKVGTVTITATLKSDETVTSSTTIAVEDVKVNKITITGYTQKYLEKDGTVPLGTTIEPENAANKDIIWSSSNPEVATVDQNGVVTAIKQGTATIQAKNEVSGVFGTQKITVYDSTPYEATVNVWVTNQNQKVSYKFYVAKDGTVVNVSDIKQNTSNKEGTVFVSSGDIRVIKTMSGTPSWSSIQNYSTVQSFRYTNKGLQYTTNGSTWNNVGSGYSIYDFSAMQYNSAYDNAHNESDITVGIGDWPYGKDDSTGHQKQTIQILLLDTEHLTTAGNPTEIYNSGKLRYDNNSSGDFGKINFNSENSKYEVTKVEVYRNDSKKKTYVKGSIPSNLTVSFSSQVDNHYVIKAYVAAKIINVRYEAAGAKEGTIPEATTVKTINPVTVAAQVPEKEGSIFVGWEYNGRTYRGGDSLEASSKDIVFTARFVEASEIINYTVNDSSMGSVSRTYERVGETVTSRLVGSTAIANKGYKFVEWINAAGEQVSTEVEFTPADKTPTTYKAVFEPVTSNLIIHYVWIDSNNTSHEIKDAVTKSYAYGAAWTEEAPEIQGYKKPSTTTQSGTKGVTTEEITFTYTKKEGKVVYNLGPNGSWGNGNPENTSIFDEAKGKWAYTYGFDKGDTFVVTDKVPVSSDNAAFVGWYDKKRDDQPAAMRTAGSKLTYPYTTSSKTNSYTLDALWEKLSGKSNEVTYDGKPHSLDAFIVVFANDNLQGWTDSASSLVQASNIQYRLKQDNREANEWGDMPSFTDAGTYTIEAQATVNGVVLTTEATLTINPRTVTLTSATDSKTYDGTPLTKPEVTVDGDGFVEGEATARATGSVTNVTEGEVTNTITIDSATGYNEDNYTITRNEGKLSIEKATVTLKSADLNKQYDGTALVNGDTALETETGWADGEGATYKFTGSQTVVGSSANAFSYTLKKGTSEANYTIAKSEGTLTVTNRDAKYEITVEGKSAKGKYNGGAHKVTGLKQSEFTVNGHKYTVSNLVTSDPEFVNAGTYQNEVSGQAKVTDEEGNDVTSEFAVTAKNGTLTIEKRPVTLTSEGGKKTYDGQPLTKPDVKVTGDGFVESEVKNIKATGSVTNVTEGEVTNTITIDSATGYNEDNYTITRNEGKLSIEKATVTLKSADLNKQYDGTALVNGDTALETETGWADGEGATYKFTGSQTVVGSSANAFSYTLKKGTSEANYTIAKSEGTLTVNSYDEAIIAKVSGTKATYVYDGTTYSVSGFDVEFEKPNGTPDSLSKTSVVLKPNKTAKASGTDVGDYKMNLEASDFEWKDANFSKVTISIVEDGLLTITPASIDPELPDPTDPDNPTENTRFEVTGLTDVLYNGAEQKQTPTIKDTTTGKALVKDTDYTITCNTKDFTNAGTITYTLSGIGNYSGTREVSYNINKRTVNLKSDTASKTYDGTALTRPNVTVTGDGFVKGEAEAIATGSVINVTATPVDNTIAIVPTEGSSYNANNYDIHKDEGKLSITAADITPTDPEKPETTRFTVEKPADTTYNGTSQQQKPVVKDGKNVLVEGTDYTLTYPENTTDANANVEVTITGIGNYAGTRTTSYAINKKAVTLTSADGSKTYDGQPLTVESVTADGFVDGQGATYGEFATVTEVTPAEGVDNTFNYTLNEGTLESNYNITTYYGSLTITPKTIVPDGPETPEEKKTGIEVTKPKDSKYDGTEHKNAPTVTDTKTGKTLTEGTDYTLTYSEDVTNAGTVTVTVTGKGNYTGEFNVTYEITKRDVVLTSATDSKKFDGTPLRNENVEVTGEGFAEGEGATYSEFAEVTNVTDEAVANTFTYALNENTLASNYNISTELGTLTITPKSIIPDGPVTPEEEKTGITVENPGDVKYDGKDHAEKPIVKDEKTGVTLEEGKDYEIVYPEDIKNAGEITATVVGKGDYEGSFEIKFNILKRDVTFTSATDSKQYDGNALTNGNVEITGDGFIEGEGATFNVTGSITDVGSTNNAFTYAMNEGTNADNYNVTVVEGTLTVSEQPVVPTPATPTTPSNNTPARTNNVPARVVTNPTTTTPAPEATVEPEKAETTPAPTAKPEKIKEEATPQAAPKGHWALINLIAAMLSVVLAVVALLAKHAKDEDDEDKDDQVVANENEDDENESTRHRRWKVIATIDAILAVVVFILTENLAHDMVLVDKWTLLMVLFGLISIVSTYFARKWHEEDEDEDEESSQNA